MPGDDAYRFRHLLIRDASYEGLPKSVRAQLHEKFALWLDERGSHLVERDEIVGYHLEQSYRYRRELGPTDAAAEQTAVAGARRLEAAGRRALDRGDESAAVNLLERASSLRPPDSLEVPLEVSLIWALVQLGRIVDAVARAEATSAALAATGDAVGYLRTELAKLTVLAFSDPEGRVAELEALIDRARPEFEEAGEDAALASLWSATQSIEHLRCRFGAAADAGLRAIDHATRAGEQYMARFCGSWAAVEIAFGPTPIARALTWLEQARGDSRVPDLWFDPWRAGLLGLVGRFEEARALQSSTLDQMTDRGMKLGVARVHKNSWRIEMAAGNFAEAERASRRACETLEEMGDRALWSTAACELAQSLYSQGSYDQAETWARRGSEAGDGDDAFTQMLSRQVLAKVQSRRGNFDDASRLASEVLMIAERIEAPLQQGDAALDVAEAMWLAGEQAEAIAHAERAVAYFELKGATVSAGRAVRFRAMVEGSSG